MNAIYRIIRAFRDSGLTDAGFEKYYATLVQRGANGGPSAAEARRDYAVVRQALDRTHML